MILGKLYVIRIEKDKNILFVKVRGFFKEEDAKGYMSEFQTAVNSINPSCYTLIVDGMEQEAFDAQLMDDLKFVLQLYWSANFKKIIIVNPSSYVSRMQVETCVKEMNFKGIFVDTLEEAFSL